MALEPLDPATRNGTVLRDERNRFLAVDAPPPSAIQITSPVAGTIISDYAVLVTGTPLAKDQSAPAILRSIDAVLAEQFGSPAGVSAGLELRSDHGPQYTGVDCEALVTRWGLAHTFAPVGRPTGNAVVERAIRTMKEEVVWLQDWEDAAQLRAALVAWQRRYNQTRPHQALGWQTPAEYRAAKLGAPAAAA